MRPDKTNIEIRFHIDNAYNTTPPEIVGLLCLRPAKAGGDQPRARASTPSTTSCWRATPSCCRGSTGRSGSTASGNSSRARARNLLRAGVREGDELRARFSAHQINGGYAMRGEPVDNEGAAALAATLDIFERRDLSIDFELEPGEIQFVDNRALGHSRTEFDDCPEPERRRHLVRLWLRDHGRRAYPG